MSKQLTAIWNTYGMVGDEQLRAASVGAKMAAQTAVDFSDIAQAMQTAAAPAAQMGVEYNQLAAIIATVGDATQQSASIIGNAYKTIFSRFQQLVSDGTDGEVTLGQVSAKLQNLGVQLLNSDGSLKNLGQTINEVGQNWNNWSQEQQLAIAQLVGGTRQYGQFLSLMQNFDKYQKNLNSARTETGSTLEEQYTQALDSIESRAENAAEAWHRAFSNVFNADYIKSFYSAVETVGEGANAFVEAIGGAPGILLAIATLFSGKIIPSLATAKNMGKQFVMSLTPAGREANIKKDFEQSRTAIQNTSMTQEQKNIATSKTNFSQKTALANEQINRQLATATGEYKLQLEMQKQLLEMAQKSYQESLDEENSLKRKVELDQIRVDKLREALAIIDETQAANQQELSDAQKTQQSAVAQQRAAQTDLDKLLTTSQGKFSSSEEMKQAMKNKEPIIANGAKDDPRTGATIRNYEELEGRIEQVIAAEERLKQATLEVAKANESVAAAQKKVSTDQEAAKAADLAGKYNEIASAVAKYDQAKMLEGQGGQEYDAVIAKIEEYISLAPQASKEVEELTKRLERLKNGEKDASLGSVLEGIQNVNAATGADGVEANGTRVTQNADTLIDEHMRNEQAIKAQEEAQKKLDEQQKLTLQQGISAAVQFGMVLTSVTMAVKNLISVWSDDSDATVFEKIGKSISIIGTMALTTIPSVISIINAVTALGAASGATGMAAFKAGLMAQTGLGPLLPVVLAITATVVALVAVIGLIADAIKKADPHYQLEQAQKDAAAFASALDDAKQEAEELKKAFDSYDEIQDKLKNCTVGTQEWKDALQEANNQVLELIRKYPELASAVETTMVNGQRVLSINKEGMDALQEKQNATVTNLSAASVSANQRVREAELNVQKSDIIKDVGYGTLTKTEQYDGGSYQSNQTGAIIDRYMKDILSATPGEMEALAQKIIEEQNLDQSVDSVKKTLEDMIPSLKEYDAAIIAATEAKKIENQVIADSIIQNSDKLSSVKDSNAMEAGGAIYGNAYDKAYKEALKDAQSRGWFNTGTADSEKSFKAYAEGLGLKDWKVTNYKGSGADASVEYEYYDDEGKKQTGEATAEMIARFNAAAIAGEELENSLIALAKQADKLADSEDNGDQALSSFLGKGNLEGATQGQFNDIKSDVENAGSAEQYLKNQFGEDLSVIATNAGYKTADEFVAAFEESLQIDWDSIPEGLREVETLTLEQAKALGDTYTKVMDISGEQAAKKYVDGVKMALEGVDEDDVATVQSIFAGIDWTKEDALNSFANQMRGLGYEIDITDKEWADLAATMRETFKVQPDLDALVASIKQANDIAGGVELGSIISQEDYQTLVAYNAALAEYFTILADGSAQMTGDPLDFQQAMRETEQQKLQDAISAYKQQMQELEGVSGSQNYVNDKGENKYRTSNVNTQLDYIEANGGASAEQIAAWREDLSDNLSTVGTIDAIGEAFDKLNISSETAAQNMQKVMTQFAMSQETFEDLRGTLNGTSEAAEAYGRAFEAMHNEEKWEGMNPDEVEDYAKGLQKAAKSSALLSDELEDNAEAAEDVALYTKKMNQGVDKLASGFKNWSDILKKSDSSSEEYISAMSQMKDAMSDVLGVSEEFLSDDFIINNMEDIKLAAEGDAEAINRLAVAAGEDIIMHMGIEDEGVLNQALDLHNELTAMIPDIEVGATLSGDDAFAQKALELIKTAGMTADQANAYFRSIGFEPNFEFEEVTDTQDIIGTRTTTSNVVADTVPLQRPDGSTEYFGYIKSADTVEEPVVTGQREVTVAVPKLSADGEPAADISFTRTNNGHNNNYSKKNSGGSPAGGSKSGGGGSSSKTPVKKVDKTERKDKLRYKDNENAVEDVTNALDRLSKANEHAFGPQKIRNINLMNVQLARQAKAYQALYDEAKMYTKLDALALDSGLADFNAKYGTTLKAEYDGDNLLDNEMELLNIITDLQNAKIAEINAVEDELNKLADKGVLQDDPQVDALNKQLETLKENLSTLDTDVESMVKKNLDNYQEAIRKAEETMQKMVDILYQGLANEIEKYTIARDLHLQINELEQKHWEAIMDNMGAVGKLGKQVADMLKKSLGSINDSVERYTKHYAQMEEVQKRWENRDITLKAEYGISDEVWDRAQQSGMIPQEIMDEFEGDIDALMDLRQQVWDNLDKQWQNYIDTIQHYIDEYDRITDRLDKQVSISDNLMHVIETVGFNYKWGADESKSYFKNMETQLDIVKNKAAAVNGELAVATNRRKEAEEELNKLLAGRSVMEFSNSANEAEMFEYNRIKEHYDDMASLEAELNAQRIELLAEAYDKATEYAEKWGEILAHEADEALNGAFDTLDEAMDMYNQKRDIDTFFMDDVDKAFELNKLKREVEDVIDDISDPEQLERYNKLLAEIEAKKEAGVKMTEKDLEILRAQFDLEQARDAYQDARNAKNTMRLTRDASGNYTYVYSEDEQSVEDQEAKVEEAMHNIYKLNRDAADEYAETWLQLQVDWENYYKSIDQARYEQDVKYRDMVDQRMKWYAEQSDLLSGEIIKHNDNIDRSYTDMTLSVITNTEDMATTNDMYKEHHTQLKEKLVENYQEWIEKADETMREVGGSMSDLEQVVDEETDKMMTEVDNLREEIDRLNVEAQSALSDLGGFIGTWCNDVNREFDTVIAKIDALIAKYLEMLRVMAQKADAAVEQGDFDPSVDYAARAIAAAKDNEWEKAWEEFNNRGYKIDNYSGTKYVPQSAATQDEFREILEAWQSGAKQQEEAIEALKNLQIEHANDPNYKGPTATGGLVTTPQVRSLAEEGPELVLNNADTENILNAVKAIRGVVQSQIGAVELGMLGKTGRIADITPYIPKAETQSVDQTVHIDASFPGVSAAAEIETALNNLIVQAAHYSLNNKQN